LSFTFVDDLAKSMLFSARLLVFLGLFGYFVVWLYIC